MAQKKVPEIGLSLGASQYMGDLNVSPIKNPSFTGGLCFLYNISTRMGFKTGLSYISFYSDGNLYYSNVNHSVNNSYINYHLSYFVNFLDYDFFLKKNNFTPYLSFGVGYSKVLSQTEEPESHFSLPFGPGLKLLIKNKISVGLEYQFYRCFTDNADGASLVNYAESDLAHVDMNSGFLNNKDWYSSLCLVITFKFINFADECPAYEP